jgi:hypothetical protein
MDEISKFPELQRSGKLQLKRDEANGAWHIRLPRIAWNLTAEKERQTLISRLAQRFPFVALWSAAEGDLTKPYSWSYPSSSQLPELIKSLYEGGWMLVFFTADPKRRLHSIPAQPLKAGDLKSFLVSVAGAATISSYYDDIEWTLVVADSSCDESS